MSRAIWASRPFEFQLAEELPRGLNRHVGERVHRGRGFGTGGKPHRAGHGIQARAVAIGAKLAAAFLPVEPRLLDRIRPRTPVHVGQIEQFAEATAFRTPALGRIVTEHLRIERVQRSGCTWGRPVRWSGWRSAVIIERKNGSVAQFQGFVDKELDGRVLFAGFAFQHAHDDFHVVLAKTVQAQLFARGINFAVRANLRVAVLGGPLGDIRVKTLAIADHRGKQQQIAALFHLRRESQAELVAGLGLDGNLAVRAILRAEARKEQADEVVNLRDGGDGAFAAAAAVALLDADGGRDAGDQIHVRPGHLIDELPGIDIHGVEEPALALGEQQVEGERTFPRTAHAGDDHELIARNGEREVL